VDQRQIPKHEMNVEDSWRCHAGTLAADVETGVRRQLYQWRHAQHGHRATCPATSSSSTGFGWRRCGHRHHRPASDIVSREFHRQIVQPEDVEKITAPVVTVDWDLTHARRDALHRILGDILPVRLVGKKQNWFAPWDELIRWWGVEDAMRDLVLRPAMVEAAISRLVDAYLSELDQWIAQGLLTPNADNTRGGSGGYGYTSALPQSGLEVGATPDTMWGSATAQIFGSVSPRMHWEFGLKHELRWLERWGLTYYGCCEPLDVKAGILERIPNLRKVSVSPWVNVSRAVEAYGGRYVLSRKPTPAFMAEDTWRPDAARADLVAFLEAARGLPVEVIMKDVSTVRYRPQRLWEWEKMAMEEVERL
jgi:hypothetical protein